jgi:hypothetical protein
VCAFSAAGKAAFGSGRWTNVAYSVSFVIFSRKIYNFQAFYFHSDAGMVKSNKIHVWLNMYEMNQQLFMDLM